LNGVIKNERVERQRREEVFVMEKDQIARDHEVELRNEKESGEKKVVEGIMNHKVVTIHIYFDCQLFLQLLRIYR
jgi:hypothetical protein